MTRFRLALFVAVFAALLPPYGRTTFAQAEARPAPTGIALEVTFMKGRAPGYLVVPGHGSEPRGGWHSLFGRVAGRETPEGAPPTRAVNVVSRLEGDFVRVNVSVFQGVRFHEKEAFVATRLLRVGERAEVGELTQFGVEPFGLKAVRVNAVLTNPPAVVSHAPSIAFTSAGVASGTTLPSHKVSLQNLSAKEVSALGVEVHVNGRRELSTVKLDPEGGRLIAAGGTYEFVIPAADKARPTPEGYAPDAPANQEVRITAAVFADGTTEGNPDTAARHKAYAAGRKAQIARLLPIFDAALNAAGDSDEPDAAQKFHKQVSALGNEADAAVLDALAKEFPTVDRDKKLKLAAEVAMSHVRVELLKEVEGFAAADREQPGDKSFRAWMGARREKFERLLARL
jgi:hypothetical protein